MRGAAAVRRVVARLGERLAAEGLRVEVGDDRVTIVGRGVREHPALRWIGGLLR